MYGYYKLTLGSTFVSATADLSQAVSNPYMIHYNNSTMYSTKTLFMKMPKYCDCTFLNLYSYLYSYSLNGMAEILHYKFRYY